MKKYFLILSTLLTLPFVCRPSAATVLLTDNFNVDSGSAETFNDTIGQTQGGTLAPVSYSVVDGYSWTAQHGILGTMLLANSANGLGYGNVSLNHDFAADANGENAPLVVSFSLVDVTGYDADPSRWVQFNVGGGQNLDIANSGVGLGVLFRKDGESVVFSAGSQIDQSLAWSPNDVISLTLSDTAGYGSAFAGNGSKAVLSIGGTTVRTYALGQLANAYVNFSAFNYANDSIGYVFGYGQFDDLSITTVPEIDPAGMGSVAALVTGALGLLERRRRRVA